MVEIQDPWTRKKFRHTGFFGTHGWTLLAGRWSGVLPQPSDPQNGSAARPQNGTRSIRRRVVRGSWFRSGKARNGHNISGAQFPHWPCEKYPIGAFVCVQPPPAGFRLQAILIGRGVARSKLWRSVEKQTVDSPSCRYLSTSNIIYKGPSPKMGSNPIRPQSHQSSAVLTVFTRLSRSPFWDYRGSHTSFVYLS